MKTYHAVAAAFAAIALALAGAPAQGADPWQTPPNSDRLLEEMKVLIEKGERERLARRSFIQDLHDLVARYEWPWTRLLLSESFADGDHTRNPAWTVHTGRFDVSRDLELVTTQEVPRTTRPGQSGQAQGNLGEQILGTILQQMRQPQQQQGRRQTEPDRSDPDRSDISTPVKITNAFDLRLVLRSLSNEGRIEFGPYIAGEDNQGYRLVYLPNGTPPLALVRYSAFGSGVVQAADQSIRPSGESRDQHLQWLRSNNGEMSVFLNGEPVIQTQDNTFTNGFDGLIISNLAGTHAFREVALYGTQ